MRGVTVLLPIYQAGPALQRAFGCISQQTLRDLEILLILNGSGAETRTLAAGLARSDPRARLIELPEANLAAALNRGLRDASHDLVARMDADDACPPDRLARQAGFLSERPDLAAVGCAWEQRTPDGRLLATIRPATDPAELRWRLLIGNDLAHGSMLLRRQPVLDAGGYDPARPRAQDYDLWLRLSRCCQVAALPDVLYTHHLPADRSAYSAGALQAAHAADILCQAWAALPALDQAGRAELTATIGAALSDSSGHDSAPAGLASLLTQRGPSKEALLALLWSKAVIPPSSRRAADACFDSRVREAGAALRAAGAQHVWIWGAGAHTARLLDRASTLGIPIAGIIDDTLHGHSRFGLAIERPDSRRAGEHVLISSDAHEDEIWSRSAPLRERAVHVHRLYG